MQFSSSHTRRFSSLSGQKRECSVWVYLVPRFPYGHAKARFLVATVLPPRLTAGKQADVVLPTATRTVLPLQRDPHFVEDSPAVSHDILHLACSPPTVTAQISPLLSRAVQCLLLAH